ncbi:hypothetical protein [Bernardetia sp.]|uniref:hypothetical protein n=1 Tax=Bernardetia sp. TaxID=1937974 RepID=UPI0025BDAEB5|nr:hypothetical protein [Bernardetia sp.]
MLPTKAKTKAISKTEDEIIWKKSFWKRKTTILYAGREIGYFKMRGVFLLGGRGILLDREFEIRSKNYWSSKFDIIDKTSDKYLATIKFNVWTSKARLYVDGEVFRFKQNMWGNGTWWWQRENGTPEEQNEKLIKTSISNYFSGKGAFRFGNTGESNLNALILGGLFIKTMNSEGYTMNY